MISTANSICKLLPPIKKKGFSSIDLTSFDAYFAPLFHGYCKTLILHKQSKSMVFNGDLYGTFFQGRRIAHSLQLISMEFPVLVSLLDSHSVLSSSNNLIQPLQQKIIS